MGSRSDRETMAEAARVLDELGVAYEMEIVSAHRTPDRMFEYAAAAEGRGVALDDHAVRVRDGVTGPRKRGDIGFATLRGGSVIGEHSVVFAGDGETVTLSHSASDRALFARGALKAVLWGRDKKPGLYAMADVLGLA